MASDLVSRLREMAPEDANYALIISSTTSTVDALREAADTIERYEAAFLRILACTPAAGNVYDCGDPFEQASDALRSQDKGEG